MTAPGAQIPHRMVPAAMPELQLSSSRRRSPGPGVDARGRSRSRGSARRRTPRTTSSPASRLAGSPGPGETITPSGCSAAISANGVPYGTTVTRRPALDQRADDVALDAAVEHDDVRPGAVANRFDLGGRDLADDVVLAGQRRRLRPRDELLVRRSAASWTRTARVSPTSRMCASAPGCRCRRSPGCRAASGSRRASRSSASGSASAQCSRTIRPAIQGWRDSSSSAMDAVVADQRVGHADDLTAERRIGADLLVAGHRGREDDLARGVDRRAEALPAKDATVRQRQRRVRGRRVSRLADADGFDRCGHAGSVVKWSPVTVPLVAANKGQLDPTSQLHADQRGVRALALRADPALGASALPGRRRRCRPGARTRAFRRPVPRAAPERCSDRRSRSLSVKFAAPTKREHAAAARIRFRSGRRPPKRTICPCFSLRRVRRVVGRHEVDRALPSAPFSSDPGVAARPQRRVDLRVRVGRGCRGSRRLVDVDRACDARNPFVGHRQVVRHHFGGHADAVPLRLADQLGAAARRDVADVQPTPGQARERDVARDDDLLGCGRNRAMPKLPGYVALVHRARRPVAGSSQCTITGRPSPARRLQRLAHDRRVSRRLAVVGKPDRAGRRQRLEVDRPLPAPPLADRGDRMQRRPRASRATRRFSSSSATTESSAGSVFGMQKTRVNPPAAAAAVPVPIVSFHS